jgi:hypothetical protein
MLIEYMPRPLITACSTKSDVEANNSLVRLIKEINRVAAKKFIDYVVSFCIDASIAPMGIIDFSGIEELHICSTAVAMDMGMYTQDLFIGLLKIAQGAENKSPSYTFLDAITTINTDVGNGLLKRLPPP